METCDAVEGLQNSQEFSLADLIILATYYLGKTGHFVKPLRTVKKSLVINFSNSLIILQV